MKQYVLAIAIALAMQAAGAAEPPDGMSEYQRFVTFPQFQRGFAAQERGDHATAVSAFERARRHAPSSPLTALHLADAYRRAGRAADARRVIAAQRRLTPGDPRLGASLRLAGRAERAVAPPPARTRGAPVAAVPGRAAASTPAKADPPGRTPRIAGERDVAGAGRRARRAREQPGADSAAEALLATALSQGDAARIGALAERLVDSARDDAGLLDRTTHRLAALGHGDLALRLLVDRWDTVASHPAMAARLAELLARNPGRITEADRARIRTIPTDPVASVGAFFVARSLADCERLTAIAPRLPAARRGGAWADAATCFGAASPDDARRAWRNAVLDGAGNDARRALAHAEFAAGDFGAALSAWRAVPDEAMGAADLIAAGNTAAASGETSAIAAWLDLHDARGHARDDAYWWLRALAATRGSVEERDALRNALAIREDARYLARLASLQREDGDAPAAVRSLERALALDPSDSAVRAALGYAYLAAGRPAEALPHLVAYQANRPREVPVAEDMAEIHRRLVQPAAARRMARTAIDLLDPQVEPERVFRLQRLHEDLGRRWAISTDTTFGSAVAASSSVPGFAYRSYAQVEVQYRLGHAIGRPDGDALAPYARLFSGSQEGGLAPDDGLTLGAGLRWKPFQSQVLYLAAEHQHRLDGAGTGDETLLRLSAAPLDDPATGRDWHPAADGWWTHALYVDVAHYLRAGRTATTLDFQSGRHFKLGQAWTLEPYARLQANAVLRSGQVDRDARIGLGARLNAWYGADRYTAFPHRAAVGIEVQRALETYLPERGTVLVTFGHLW